MPLPRYTVQPAKISEVSVPKNFDDELELVSNFTFCNLMRQMACVVKIAASIFDELIVELSSLTARSKAIDQRITTLSATIKQIPTSEDCLSTGLQNISLQIYKSNTVAESQVLSRNTKPSAIRICYEQADPPPPLHIMDHIRDDGKTSLRLYSDPSFFFELWSHEMLENCRSRKAPRRKRPKSKSKHGVIKSGTSQRPAKISGPSGANNLPPPPPPVVAMSHHSTNHTRSHFISLNSALDTSSCSPLPPPPQPPSITTVSAGCVAHGEQRRNIHQNYMIEPFVVRGHLEHDEPITVHEITDEDRMCVSTESPPPPPLPPAFDLSLQPGTQDTSDMISPYLPCALPPPCGLAELPSPPHSLSEPDGGVILGSHPRGSLVPPPPPPPPNTCLAQLSTAPRPPQPPAAPTQDLLSAIRAGCQLRKVGQRLSPSSAHCQANTKSGQTASSEPGAVQAIFEEISKRRRYLENTSDEDGDSDSSEWED